jgi:hypothetical protein
LIVEFFGTFLPPFKHIVIQSNHPLRYKGHVPSPPCRQQGCRKRGKLGMVLVAIP